MLDTSAVIGWLERDNPMIIEILEHETEIPLIHMVTVGELHEGVRRARDHRPDVLHQRRATLRFTLAELRPCHHPMTSDAECFGLVSVHTSRQLSQNDKWIIAHAAVHGHDLATEDLGIGAAITDNSALAGELMSTGWTAPRIRVCTRPSAS